MKDHYSDTLQKLLAANLIRPDMRVLVACGSRYDRDRLLEAGFKNVTISNLDTHLEGSQFVPFSWSFQDAEKLTFQDDEFDFCIVHDGLHHCRSPHRALLELYRVARSGLLVFEPRDSLLTRLGVRLNFGQDYEVAAVIDNGSTFGGMRNTALPNYVYRWTEREIEKTICSNAPWGQHQFLYFYHLRVPWRRLRMLRNKTWYLFMLAALPMLTVLKWLFPRQANTFGFAVFKPDPTHDLQPWLERSNGEFRINSRWLSSRYKAPLETQKALYE